VALQVKVFGVEATSPRIIAAQLESELNKALGEIVKGWGEGRGHQDIHSRHHKRLHGNSHSNLRN